MEHDPDVYIYRPPPRENPGAWTSTKARSKISHDIADYIDLKEALHHGRGTIRYRTDELYVKAEAIQIYMASEKMIPDPPSMETIIDVAQNERPARSGDHRFIVHMAPDGAWISKRKPAQ